MPWGVRTLGFTAAADGIKDLGNDWRGPVVRYVGTNVEYAAYVELGTSRMEAQPYLFPAAMAVSRNPTRYISNPQSLEEFIEQLAYAIEREAKIRCPVDTGNLRASIRVHPA